MNNNPLKMVTQIFTDRKYNKFDFSNRNYRKLTNQISVLHSNESELGIFSHFQSLKQNGQI